VENNATGITGNRLNGRVKSTAAATERKHSARTAWLATAHTSDRVALGVLALLVLVGLLMRFIYDNWLGEEDILTKYMPWFAYVGSRLASGELPAWNTHYFSGSPVIGNPGSGWLYLPVMLIYPVFKTLTATKVLLTVHAILGAGAFYALARRLGLIPVAALMSSSVFVLGQVLYGFTNHMTAATMASVWLVIALLAMDMGLSAKPMSATLGWTALAGLALCQVFMIWPGQGTIYALIWLGCWLVYRCVFDSRHFLPSIGDRIAQAVIIGGGTVFFGLALGAAGILPMLDVVRQSIIADGDYSNLVSGNWASEAPGLLRALGWMLHGARNPELTLASQAFGMPVMILAVVGAIRARRQYAAPYFAGMFVLSLALTLRYSPLLWLFERTPGIGSLHDHHPSAILWLVAIAPAMLTGVAVQTLLQGNSRKFTPNQAFGLCLLLLTGIAVYNSSKLWPGWWPILCGALAILILLLPQLHWPWLQRQTRHVPALSAWLLVALIVFHPTLRDFGGAIWDPVTDVGGITISPGKEPASTWAIETTFLEQDPGAAAEFLQQQDAENGPFRFSGYAGQGYPDWEWLGYWNEGERSAYAWRRLQPGVIGILVNGRTQALDLDQTGGYNPAQLRYYNEYVNTMNGARQDFRWLDTFESALDGSQLLDMLNVRYILVSRFIDPARSDVQAIAAAHPEVYRDSLVIVYENTTAFGNAWIVHDVRDNGTSGFGVRLLAAGLVDGHDVAFVNTGGVLPEVAEPAPGSAPDSVSLLDYAPESMTFAASTSAAGLMVISEVYADGWNAYVDGEKVDIIRTNHALRGVPISAGDHTVELKYEPESLRIGMMATGGMAIVMIGIWVWALVDWRRRDPDGAVSSRSKGNKDRDKASGKNPVSPGSPQVERE